MVLNRTSTSVGDSGFGTKLMQLLSGGDVDIDRNDKRHLFYLVLVIQVIFQFSMKTLR